MSSLLIIRGIWILGEEKYRHVIWIDVSGAIMNIVLNVILIRPLGFIGAAIASVVTQFFMNFVMGFLIKPLRQNSFLMLKGLDPRFAVKCFRSFLKSDESS